MQRCITGYHLDEENDWVAELDCGHGQHVRHKPPFFNRPWVVTEAGRNEKLGLKLDCVRCDRLEIPAEARFYKSTPSFTDQTLPAGLLKQHTTAAGTWARIVLSDGEIGYRLGAPLNRYFRLTPAYTGIIPPQVAHALEPCGPVVLHIEFYSLS